MKLKSYSEISECIEVSINTEKKENVLYVYILNFFPWIPDFVTQLAKEFCRKLNMGP